MMHPGVRGQESPTLHDLLSVTVCKIKISQQISGSTNSIIYYSLFVVVDVENEGVWRVQQHKGVGR